jgi:hypothetical protein
MSFGQSLLVVRKRLLKGHTLLPSARSDRDQAGELHKGGDL